eukprot:5592229-Pyramimonas_sp.AAC.1
MPCGGFRAKQRLVRRTRALEVCIGLGAVLPRAAGRAACPRSRRCSFDRRRRESPPLGRRRRTSTRRRVRCGSGSRRSTGGTRPRSCQTPAPRFKSNTPLQLKANWPPLVDEEREPGS